MAGFNEYKYVTEAQNKIREAQKIIQNPANNDPNSIRNNINDLKKYLVQGLRTSYPDTYRELQETISKLEKAIERGI